MPRAHQRIFTMKILLATLIVALIPLSAHASDKDILRDACSAMKQAGKRSECFNALERISIAANAKTLPAAPAKRADLKLNPRAFECAPMEYSEIDSMPREELEGLYCSYVVGSDVMHKISNASVERASDPRVKAALLGDSVRNLERCTSGMAKAIAAFNRKHPGEKPDCTEMKAQVEANREAYRKKKEAEAQTTATQP